MKPFKKSLRELVTEFSSASPTRNWGLELLPERMFKTKQKETQEWIDDFTEAIIKLFRKEAYGHPTR